MKQIFVQAQADHIESLFKGSPLAAIEELVWNALDADAREVKVDLITNPLGAVEAVRVTDDGTGIDALKADQTFGNLGGSWKRIGQGTQDRPRRDPGRSPRPDARGHRPPRDDQGEGRRNEVRIQASVRGRRIRHGRRGPRIASSLSAGLYRPWAAAWASWVAARACVPPACAAHRADERRDAISAAEEAWEGGSRGHRNEDSACCPSRGNRNAPARLPCTRGKFWPHAACAEALRPQPDKSSPQRPQKQWLPTVSSCLVPFRYLPHNDATRTSSSRMSSRPLNS